MIIYSYISPRGFSVKLKREGLTEKLICRGNGIGTCQGTAREKSMSWKIDSTIIFTKLYGRGVKLLQHKFHEFELRI